MDIVNGAHSQYEDFFCILKRRQSNQIAIIDKKCLGIEKFESKKNLHQTLDIKLIFLYQIFYIKFTSLVFLPTIILQVKYRSLWQAWL